MTSRERVLTALNHEEPDRVPIDLGGNQTGIHKDAYRDLIEHLGIDDEVTIMDPVQQLARPCEELLQEFQVDTRYIAAGAASDFDGTIERNERDGKVWHDLVDEFGVRWSMPDDAPRYMDITHHPLAEATLDDVRDYPFPKGDDPGRFEGLRERALTLRNETPYAVVSGISGVVYETCWYLRGLEQWFCDLMTEPEFCEAVIDRVCDFWMDFFRVFCDEVGDVVDVIMIGDDLAGQSGPLFDPKIYRSIVKPRQQKVARYIREHASAKLWYHTCGDCREYIPDLIENGVQALNPVQISARGMDPEKLKREWGDRITFWGGACDSQHVLPVASSEDVYEHVRHNVDIFKPGGGFVFNNVHNIQGGVPPENIVALYRAARDGGAY
ncbi:uroporphyrinogen decarboxylase family protein [Kiritimatiella glycovorans]|uniref:Putative methyltransferase n=1 Tax=Kiritimatiella glycovorans TaxID=1307763 RepID=A0A0G3EG26_9BACT|nr:uroporphyrinogen decarboxylase family protein [Kiritimatiella glycovorans]AKJ65396.1 putative methyltransferase [Kiritimatiella glycovorans]